MQNALADMTDYDEGCEKTEIDRGHEANSIFEMIGSSEEFVGKMFLGLGDLSN